MPEPRGLKSDEIEVRAALFSAWLEVMKRHATADFMDLDGSDLREALKSVFMMVGNVAGMMIADAARDPSDREWLSQCVSMNLPLGIEWADRIRRHSKAN